MVSPTPAINKRPKEKSRQFLIAILKPARNPLSPQIVFTKHKPVTPSLVKNALDSQTQRLGLEIGRLGNERFWSLEGLGKGAWVEERSEPERH